jgi:UDP:flavonoid glycosyltransferase YjiC (YdhE family)
VKVLLTGLPIFSHLIPVIVPVADALSRSGHEVAVATGRSMAGELGERGIRCLRLPGVGGHAELLDDPEFAELKVGEHPAAYVGGQAPSDAEADLAFQQMFFGPLARRFADGVVAQAGSWGADLIVSESLEYGGYVAAELIGLPHAVLDTAPMMVARHPAIPQWLDDLRVTSGLGRADETTRHGAALRAGLLPQAWYPEPMRQVSHRYYRPDHYRAAEPVDPAIAALPAADPLVLVAMGSGAPEHTTALARTFGLLAEALGSVQATAIVVLGQGHDQDTWTGPRPANVHLTTSVPQQSLLAACSAFVTHAGFSSVREAMLAGVPMVTIPLFGEQPQNAARVAELGLGVNLDVTALDAGSVAQAVTRVLSEPSFTTAARGMHLASLGLPGLDQLTADLVKLTH